MEAQVADADLGERMRAALQTALDTGHRKVSSLILHIHGTQMRLKSSTRSAERATHGSGAIMLAHSAQQTQRQLSNLLYMLRLVRPLQVILVGTDIPGLSTDVMIAALAALDDSQLVLGPAMDGGFYLIGATVVPQTLMSVSGCLARSSHRSSACIRLIGSKARAARSS